MNEQAYFEQFVGDSDTPQYWAIVYGTKYIHGRYASKTEASAIMGRLQGWHPRTEFYLRPSYPNGDVIGFIYREITS